METLEINGKRYMKASSAARETGYTMDYIGQLCRKKRIDSTLVGRTWYVLESEIHDHRRTRGRSNTQKVRESVQQVLREKPEIKTRHIVPEYRKRLVSHEVTYHSDEAELLPPLAPRHLTVTSHDREVTINTKDETELRVKSDETSELSLNPIRTKQSEVKWNGTIVVSPLDASEEVEPELLETHLKLTPETNKSEPVEVQVIESSEETSSDDTVIPVQKKENRESTPRFVDRLNHAHVLNEVDIPSPDEANLNEITSDYNVSPANPAPIIASSSLVFSLGIACVAGVLLLSNVLIERVVFVDQERNGLSERHIMILRFELVSLSKIQSNAALLLTSMRNSVSKI